VKKNFMQTIASTVVLAFTLNLAAAEISSAQDNATAQLKQTFDEFKQNMGGNNAAFSILAEIYSTLDRNGDGISKDEVDLSASISEARMRSQMAAQILAFDLNADLIVTADEIITANQPRMRRGMNAGLQKGQVDVQNQAILKQYMMNDSDGTKSLAGKELYAVSDRMKQQHGMFGDGNSINIEMARALLNADPNADGLVTESEGLALLAAVTK
jgi:hypothetical protein